MSWSGSNVCMSCNAKHDRHMCIWTKFLWLLIRAHLLNTIRVGISIVYECGHRLQPWLSRLSHTHSDCLALTDFSLSSLPHDQHQLNIIAARTRYLFAHCIVRTSAQIIIQFVWVWVLSSMVGLVGWFYVECKTCESTIALVYCDRLIRIAYFTFNTYSQSRTHQVNETMSVTMTTWNIQRMR